MIKLNLENKILLFFLSSHGKGRIGICIGPWEYEEGHQSLDNYDIAVLGYHVPRWYLSDGKIIDDRKYLSRGFVVVIGIFVK